MAKREPRIRRWMERKGIADDRFKVDWVSASEGKKWQGIMQNLTEVVEKYNKETTAPKPKSKPKAKSKPKTATKKTSKKKSSSKPKKAAKKATKPKKKQSKK